MGVTPHSILKKIASHPFSSLSVIWNPHFIRFSPLSHPTYKYSVNYNLCRFVCQLFHFKRLSTFRMGLGQKAPFTFKNCIIVCQHYEVLPGEHKFTKLIRLRSPPEPQAVLLNSRVKQDSPNKVNGIKVFIVRTKRC